MEELIDEFLREHLFKLSLGVGVAYAGVLIAMGIDFVFGVKKARELEIDTTSTGFKMTATKAQKYFSPMLCLTVVDMITAVYIPVPAFTLLWACYCCFCEFKSVTEKSWKKKELRDAANTMKVVIENKDDFAKVLAELLKDDKDGVKVE